MCFSDYIHWRIRDLTDDEIKEGFAPDSIDVSYETDTSGSQYPIIEFKPEFSPYGMNGPTVRFANPQLPCNPDGTLCRPDLTQNQLFRGGFDFCPALSLDIYKCFGSGVYILKGSYDRDQNIFTVCNHGLDLRTGCASLLTRDREPDDRKAARVAAEVAKSALYASSFVTDYRSIRDVFVLEHNIGLTVNGKLAKGRFHPDSRIRTLQRRSFSPAFQFYCVDDGVAYADAWVLDRYGSIVSPSEVREFDSRLPEQTVKRWSDLQSFDVCLYCQVNPDGTVEFCDSQVNFVWETSQSGTVTELQRRRMFLIRQQVVAKLRESQQAYQAILSKPAQDFPEWGELGRI